MPPYLACKLGQCYSVSGGLGVYRHRMVLSPLGAHAPVEGVELHWCFAEDRRQHRLQSLRVYRRPREPRGQANFRRHFWLGKWERRPSIAKPRQQVLDLGLA
jgi:hypothetical protein